MTTENEPAFPTPHINYDKSVDYLNGMTKREYFAIQALNGLLSSLDGNVQGMEPNKPNIEYFATLSVKAADFLIQKLNQS